MLSSRFKALLLVTVCLTWVLRWSSKPWQLLGLVLIIPKYAPWFSLGNAGCVVRVIMTFCRWKVRKMCLWIFFQKLNKEDGKIAWSVQMITAIGNIIFKFLPDISFHYTIVFFNLWPCFASVSLLFKLPLKVALNKANPLVPMIPEQILEANLWLFFHQKSFCSFLNAKKWVLEYFCYS